MKAVGQYLLNWAHLLDQALNCLLAGDPRQTLSARMGRDIEAGRCLACKRVCGVLDLIQKDHCAKSWAKWKTVQNPDMQTAGD